MTELYCWISNKIVKLLHLSIFIHPILETTELILVGDFNCSLLKYEERSLNSFKNLQHHFDFVDLWKKLNQKKWRDGRDTAIIRIYYVFFLTQHFCYKPENVDLRRPQSVSNVRMSDHITLILNAKFSLSYIPRHRQERFHWATDKRNWHGTSSFLTKAVFAFWPLMIEIEYGTDEENCILTIV